MKLFDFVELKYKDISTRLYDWLKTSYNKNSVNFDSSSPYGQIINVNTSFFQKNILYLKNAIKTLILDDDSLNQKYINSLARVAGHNPSRAISASGVLRFKLKNDVDITDEISGSKVTINNYLKLKNKTNNLFYTLFTGVDSLSIDVSLNNEFYINIKQGQFEKVKFTGDGTINQSLNVSVKNNTTIDNFEYYVKYNGLILNIKENITDMLTSELACVIKTGISGGIDIYFGNTDFGFIPLIGSTIEVGYLLTDGLNGNIYNNVYNDFQFIDSVLDNQLNTLNMDKLFDVVVDKNVIFGSNGESIKFTKSILPYVSRNFVLASPNQFIYHLKKLALFSKINVHNTLEDFDNTNDNKVYLYLIPMISNYFTNKINYFNIQEDVFYLDEYEQNKIIEYLKTMGIIQIGTEIQIIQPKLTKYSMYINVRKFNNYNDDTIKQQIVDVISNYLIYNERTDRIVKSELISIMSQLDGIDSVDLFFVSKQNEENYINTNIDLNIGIDPIMGDIIAAKDEYPIIRGGWKDRHDIYYYDNLDYNKVCSINININGITNKNINN